MGNNLLGEPDYTEFVERFERWCNASDLEKIKKELFIDEEELGDDVADRLKKSELGKKQDLLNKKLEDFFQQGSSDKPWLKWQPTQNQADVFFNKYNVPRLDVQEDQKRYDYKFEFKTEEYFYRKDKNVYADFKKDKIYENVKETNVKFSYGERTVLRDSKGRFIKHIKDIKTGFWLI